MSSILISLGALPVIAVRIGDLPLRIGRASDSDVVLPLPEVAERHAVIEPGEGPPRVRAEAGESLRLAGDSVTQALLSPGTVIELGGYLLRWDPEGTVSEGLIGATRTAPLDEPGHNGLEGELSPVAAVSVIAGPDAGMSLSVNHPTVLVGRAPDCDLMLRDESVSWRHLSLGHSGVSLKVHDLGSTNGTWLNGVGIETATATRGSRIRIGRSILLLEDESEVRVRKVLPQTAARVGGRLPGLAELVGYSEVMQNVYERINEAAASRVPVLLLGQTGTGKELAARAIHALSTRASGPFVPINCAAIPHEMIEDELFGHSRGAFTGAFTDRRGAFQEANGGTIFLDELAELSPLLQPKLLRVIEEAHVPRVGGGGGASDFRIIAATNRDVEGGALRPDLFYRLAACQILMPPLVDRLEDIPDLVHAFLDAAERQTGVAGAARTRFEEEAFGPLRHHSWPGNVRELRNLIVRAVLRRAGGLVERSLVMDLLRGSGSAVPRGESRPAGITLLETERQAIVHALEDCNGQRRAAARRLGIAESTLYAKLHKHRLQEYKPGE